jgi:hypothetical protein
MRVNRVVDGDDGVAARWSELNPLAPNALDDLSHMHLHIARTIEGRRRDGADFQTLLGSLTAFQECEMLGEHIHDSSVASLVKRAVLSKWGPWIIWNTNSGRGGCHDDLVYTEVQCGGQHGAHTIDVRREDLMTIDQRVGDNSRDLIDSLAAVHCLNHVAPVADIAVKDLKGKPLEERVPPARFDEYAHTFSVLHKPACQRRPETAGGAGYENVVHTNNPTERK